MGGREGMDGGGLLWMTISIYRKRRCALDDDFIYRMPYIIYRTFHIYRTLLKPILLMRLEPVIGFL